MQKSNVNACPHRGHYTSTIKTTDGRTVVLCDACMAELESRLADPLLIQGMLKSTMSAQEIEQMRYEHENMALEKDLADTVAAAHMVAGFPRWLALPAPEAVA